MDSNLRNEILLVMQNYTPAICPDCQVKILAQCTKFVNNTEYMNKIKSIVDTLFTSKENYNFWIEIPKIISVIIDINKTIISVKDIEVDYMKFVIYAIIYSYFDAYQRDILDKQDEGDLRICFINILNILLIKPKKIAMKSQSLFSILFNCICGDDGIIKV